MTLVLSRYAAIRRAGARLVADAGRAERVELGAREAAFVLAFVAPAEPAAAAATAGLAAADADGLVGALVAAGVLVDAARGAGEDAGPWSFDAGRGSRRNRVGGRDPALHGPIEGAFPERRWPAEVRLERPEPQGSRPLAELQELRRSRREHGPQPLALAVLGELLWRTLGVVDLLHQPVYGLTAVRPYPCGGALYELEAYVAVRACAGLEPGLWHFDACEHALARVPAAPADAERLLRDAASAMATTSVPQVLLILAARLGRLAGKYDELAWSLVLRHVGVVTELVSLTAADLDIACCPVGTGDAEVFARATGLSPEDQRPVGEIALGSAG